MKELLTYIAQSLVDNPDEVNVTERATDEETVFEVRVAWILLATRQIQAK